MTSSLLETAVVRGVTNPPGESQIHGEQHWKAVALMGFELARAMPGTPWDLEMLLQFAQLHDVMRENDDEDPEHGARAAELFTELVIHPGIPEFSPYSERTMALAYAIHHHTDPGVADEADTHSPTVGLCWDADRLNLWRVGKAPHDDYLTTVAAKSRIMKKRGHYFAVEMYGALPGWDEIALMMQNLRFP